MPSLQSDGGPDQRWAFRRHSERVARDPSERLVRGDYSQNSGARFGSRKQFANQDSSRSYTSNVMVHREGQQYLESRHPA